MDSNYISQLQDMSQKIVGFFQEGYQQICPDWFLRSEWLMS